MAGRQKAGAGFWIFLYSIGTLTVFLVVLLSQTQGGRAFITTLGGNSLGILSGVLGALQGAWEGFLAWLPPEWRPGSRS